MWLVGVKSRRQVWLWEWMESMGVVSRRLMWVESMDVASGCGCKEVYIDFLVLLIPTPLVSSFFCSSIPTFVHFKNVFRSCSGTLL